MLVLVKKRPKVQIYEKIWWKTHYNAESICHQKQSFEYEVYCHYFVVFCKTGGISQRKWAKILNNTATNFIKCNVIMKCTTSFYFYLKRRIEHDMSFQWQFDEKPLIMHQKFIHNITFLYEVHRLLFAAFW